MGAGRFHDRVRHGIGWDTPAKATGPARRPQDPAAPSARSRIRIVTGRSSPIGLTASGQTGSVTHGRSRRIAGSGLARGRSDRAIRTARLHVLPRFHLRPIDVLV